MEEMKDCNRAAVKKFTVVRRLRRAAERAHTAPRADGVRATTARETSGLSDVAFERARQKGRRGRV